MDIEEMFKIIEDSPECQAELKFILAKFGKDSPEYKQIQKMIIRLKHHLDMLDIEKKYRDPSNIEKYSESEKHFDLEIL